MTEVKNTAAFVVTIDGKQVIAPNATASVDEKHKGVADLIERGVLVEVEVVKPSKAEAKETKGGK